MSSRKRVNPYIAGPALSAEQGFFGRKDILDWVLTELSNEYTNALVLYGQRRVGKTTILLQLQRYLPLEKFFPVYLDLQDQAKRHLGEVLADLADSIGNRLNSMEYKPQSFDNEGEYFCSTFLPNLYDALDKECRPVFLLDEFDVLDQENEEQLENTVASRSLFPFLRKLMNADVRPAFVFVVGRRAEDLRVNFNQMFKTSLTKEIWVLDDISAESLIRQAETNRTLKFTQPAVDCILHLTSNHTYLTQLICQRIWQRAYLNKPTETPTIDVEKVISSIPDTFEMGEQALVWLWNGLGPAEKIYASALAEISNEREPIPEGKVINVLAEHATLLRRREVARAPQDLVTRHVLDLTENREYLFAIELFRRWVKQKRLLRDVVDEIDEGDPLAQKLFQLGYEFYKKHDWNKAIPFFQDALEQSSGHLLATLLLGETYLSMGRVEDAVHQLEAAYSLDKNDSQYPLAKALIALARIRADAGSDQDALTACERALEVSPNELVAQEIKKGIFERQGDAAFNRSDLESALTAFEKAGSIEKLQLVKDRIQRANLQKLENEANALVNQMAWKKAIAVIEKLIKESPNDKSTAHWLSKLEFCKEEDRLENLFTLGLGALTQENWDQAKKTFAEVIYIRPDYQRDNKLAVELLVQAIRRIKRKDVEPAGLLKNIAARWTKEPAKFVNTSKRSPRLDAVLIQLGSQRPSDVFRGMEKVRQWLREDPENPDVYGLLLDAVKEHRDLREQIRNLLYEMGQKGSRSAQEAISSLPSSVQDILADADDAYYAGEYEQAVQLYRQVLKLDPENERAKDHLAKAEAKRITGEPVTGLPRVAEQYYRRARSFVAARDIVTAMNLLSAAIEAAKGKGMPYPEAEEALNNMQNLLVAEELRQQARIMLEKEQWNEASDLYNKALNLDPTSDAVKKERGSLQGLLEAQSYLRGSSISLIFTPLIKWQNIVDTARVVMKPASVLINFVQGQLNRIKLMRGVSYAAIALIIAIPLFSSGMWRGEVLVLTDTSTPIISLQSGTSIGPVSIATKTFEPTMSVSSTIVQTQTLTPTKTPTMSPTAVVIGVGYINKATASAWGEPNSILIERLGLNQPLILLEKVQVAGSMWYRCAWEKDSTFREGWILADNINFGTPPN